MSIKSLGGVFGRNPTFNDVTVEGDLSVAGTLSVNGNVLSGLDFEGAWDATSGAPSATPSTGQFWIVSVAGTTNLSGITNWGIGDWALYDGSAWQRIEGGADGNFKQLTSSSTTVLNGTTIPASKTLVVTTDIGSTVEAYDATILKSADIGSTVQAYDATILTSSDIGSTVQGYDAGTLTSADIGSTVQAYDADTAKLDVNQTWTGTQAFNGDVVINEAGADVDFRVESDTDTHALFLDAGNSRVGVNTSNPVASLQSGVTSLGATSIPPGEAVFASAATANNEALLIFGRGNIDASGNTGVTFSFNPNRGASGAATGWYQRVDGATAAGYMSFGQLIRAASGSATLDEHLRIDSSSNLKLNSGNLVIGTSGKGIDFSATSGTGTSELFDDYEEGTFTPVYEPGSGSFTTVPYDPATFGVYTKIGDTVYISCRVRTDATIVLGTASGQLKIGGLPFTATGTSALSIWSADFGGDNPSAGITVSNTFYLYYRTTANGTAGNLLDVSDLNLGSNNRNDVIVSGFYKVA